MVRFSIILIKKLVSLFLLCSLAFITIALLTFNAEDPSLLKANDNHIANLGGAFGANVADLIVQSLGFTIILPFLFLLVLGVKLLIGNANRLLLVCLIVLLLMAMPCFSITLSMLQGDKSTGFSIGGYFGNFLKYHLIAHFDLFTLLIISTFLTIVTGIFCIGLSLSEWKKVLRVSYISICKFFRFISFILKYIMKVCKAVINRVKVTDEELIGGDIEKQEDNSLEQVPRKVDKISNKVLDIAQERQVLPPYYLLKSSPSISKKNRNLEDVLVDDTETLSSVLVDFGVKGKITNVSTGPVVTLYELEPAAGTKSSRIICLADDIARSMSSTSARIAVMPGKNALGIELPNESRETVYLRELLESVDYQNSEVKLPLVLGKNIGGIPVVADLTKMPHLLVAGTTGSGKSVAINTMILSILYKLTAKQCKFVMIDPKMLELSVYEGIPHLLSPVVTEPKKAVSALKWVVQEMEKRYRLMSMLGVRNITGYNDFIKEKVDLGEDLEKKVQTGFDPATGEPLFEQIKLDDSPLPYIVVIVDEMADLMLVAGKEIEGYIQRIAQMARAAGIHLIMATQRPSVDVITGVIKANFPTRISFQVTSKIDSRTILGEQGAEQLLGMGDMLFMMAGGRVERVHAPFVNDNEVEKVVSFLKKQGKPEYVTDIIAQQEGDSSDIGSFSMQNNGDGNDIYKQAISIVLTDNKATTSYLQRKLKIGYNRAASLIEKMEEEGIVSSPNHVGKREILIKQQE